MGIDEPLARIRHAELRAGGRLAGEGLGGIVDLVSDVHGAVARRVDRQLPPGGSAVMAVHDAIAGATYAAVGQALRWAPRLGAEVAVRAGRTSTPPSHTPVGRQVLPAINGLWGDRIADRHPALAVDPTVRVGHADVRLDRAPIAAAFPDATERVVVFLHGLCEHDQSWRVNPPSSAGSTSDRTSTPYGERLSRDLGYTPVYLRYNTGRRISENGRAISRLLSELMAAWPVEVRDLALVGHSMGGLVARSATHHGRTDAAGWVERHRHNVSLGTPHLGAPLEKGVHAADWLLRRLPETEPFGRVVRARSVGIQDLRFGAIVDQDWTDPSCDEFLRDRSTEVPFVDHVTYCFVAGTIAADRNHPLGRLVGDGMVRYASAAGSGRTRRVPFHPANGRHVGRAGHLALLNHPEVYTHLRGWLGEESGTEQRGRGQVIRPALERPGAVGS